MASVLWWEGAGGMYMFITLLSYTIGCLFVSDVEDILGAGCRNTVWQRYLIYDLNVRHVDLSWNQRCSLQLQFFFSTADVVWYARNGCGWLGEEHDLQALPEELQTGHVVLEGES